MNASDTALQNTQANKEKSAEGHQRNRSISEYVPEAMQVPKTRHITVSGSHAPIDATPDSSLSGDMLMRREPHLAAQRGLAPAKGPPTPPSSRTGGESSDSDSSLSTTQIEREKTGPKAEFFDAKTRDGAKRRWRGLRILGEGTFSRVMLATSQLEEEDNTDEDDVFGQPMDGIMTPVPEAQSEDRRKKLVAIKICEHGPKGGASEQRVEMSLKRELEIMISIHHPSLVHLKAWNIEETRAILVLSYCPGGDLFEVASQHRNLLVPSLLRRMFSELTGAVQYLHERHIVHRDIKLESKQTQCLS
jgi:protein-serine/threonine kinase